MSHSTAVYVLGFFFFGSSNQALRSTRHSTNAKRLSSIILLLLLLYLLSIIPKTAIFLSVLYNHSLFLLLYTSYIASLNLYYSSVVGFSFANISTYASIIVYSPHHPLYHKQFFEHLTPQLRHSIAFEILVVFLLSLLSKYYIIYIMSHYFAYLCKIVDAA